MDSSSSIIDTSILDHLDATRIEAAFARITGTTVTDFVELCRGGYCPTLQTELPSRPTWAQRRHQVDAHVVAAALTRLGLPWMARQVAA